MSSLKLIFLLTIVHYALSLNFPVVMWHGIGADRLESIKQIIRDNIDDSVYVKSIQLGETEIADIESGIFVHPNDQIEQVCLQIKEDENLTNGFHAIGFSQGAQFFRGLIQRCAHAKVINFISLGGQHQGVFGVPSCSVSSRTLCKFYRVTINFFAYTDWVQRNIAQATYWHDPLNEETYRAKSSFLADINNERKINRDYIRRLQSLKKFVMVKFLRDKIVEPIETSWFGFFKPGSTKVTQSLTESEMFTQDELGLRQMMKDRKLVFIEVDEDHVTFDDDWFINEIIPFLKN